jgi:uncharacterized protein YdaU (DUF1376 family)
VVNGISVFIFTSRDKQKRALTVNYYPHHIGDYLRDTAHLSMLEDAAYRRMLDWYYASEKPLPLDIEYLYKLCRAKSSDEREAVDGVLHHFFRKYPDGWHNKRADEEIRKGRRRIKTAKANGKRGGRPKTQRVSENNPTGSHPSFTHQKPKAKEKEADPPAGGTIWNLAIPLLCEQGLKEPSARAFIGSCLRDWESVAVEDAFRAAAGKADAKAYVLGILRQTPRKGLTAERKVAMP